MAPDRTREKIASFLLRTGLAVLFLYSGISSLFEPEAWIGFIPSFILSIIPGDIALLFVSILEILLFLWLVSGIMTYEAAAVSATALFLIVIFNLDELNFVFKDFAMIFAAISLCVLTKKDKKNGRSPIQP